MRRAIHPQLQKMKSFTNVVHSLIPQATSGHVTFCLRVKSAGLSLKLVPFESHMKDNPFISQPP